MHSESIMSPLWSSYSSWLLAKTLTLSPSLSLCSQRAARSFAFAAFPPSAFAVRTSPSRRLHEVAAAANYLQTIWRTDRGRNRCAAVVLQRPVARVDVRTAGRACRPPRLETRGGARTSPVWSGLPFALSPPSLFSKEGFSPKNWGKREVRPTERATDRRREGGSSPPSRRTHLNADSRAIRSKGQR